MKTQSTHYHLIGYFIACVWLANGLVCKVLGLVLRHEAIVARILGENHAHLFTLLIGFAEIGMAIWIFSGKWSRFNAIFQMFIIAAMNAIEFVMARDLLLWGNANALFAALFILLIWYREFRLGRKTVQPQLHA